MFARRVSLLFVLLTMQLMADGQETINHASLAGRVTDPSGAMVIEASVTARQVETNVNKTTITDREGRFRFPYLPVGQYEITVHKEGFADAARTATLTLGAAFDLPVSLTIGASDSVITVSGEAPVIEGDRSQIAGTILSNELQTVPLNGRNFLDLALLAPGVAPTNTASTQLFAETSAVPGQGISVSSQRNFSNSFIVDGLSANDDAAGLTGTFYGMGVVREFQVVTSGGQAEFGRALGGYINMVTQSGSNSLHGDVYGFLRNQRLNAQNALSHSNLPLTQAQYGAGAGGPIRRDRTFFFTNFEQRRLHQDGLITIAPVDANAINARLVLSGYQGLPVATGLFPNPVRTSNFLAKVDHQPSQNDQLTARYSFYRADSDNSRGVGALSALSAAAGLKNFDQTLAISNIATLSPATTNETRGQFTRSSLEAPPNDSVGPAVNISGVAQFGRLSASPTARLNNMYELVDNISRQVGAHALRAGTDFLYNNLTIAFPQSLRGIYSFSSLSNFQKGIYNASGFTQSFGNPMVTQNNPNIGFYAQDEWKVRPRFTLNAGLRYDLQYLDHVATDTNNVSPRIGFAWSPFSNQGTVVRGSFGLFYDRVPLRALSNALESSGNTTNLTDSTFVTVSVSPTQAGAPVFPNILSSLPPRVLVNFTTMNPHMQNAYSEQAGLEIERQLSERSTLAVSYQHVRGLHLLISVNKNAPTCAASGTNNGCRQNPNFGNNRQYDSAADSYYDGLSFSFVQRPARWGSYRVSYTWSKALDDVGEFFFSSPINNFNLAEDKARSDDDQRQRLVFDGSIHSSQESARGIWGHLTQGFALSGMLQYYSAPPFNITQGANSVQGTSLRPCMPGIVNCSQVIPGTVIARNAGIGFDYFNLNTRLSRTFSLGERFHLEGIAEAFNVLNHRNDLIPNSTFGNGAYPANPLPAFGKPTAVADARQVQLALRMTF